MSVNCFVVSVVSLLLASGAVCSAAGLGDEYTGPNGLIATLIEEPAGEWALSVTVRGVGARRAPLRLLRHLADAPKTVEFDDLGAGWTKVHVYVHARLWLSATIGPQGQAEYAVHGRRDTDSALRALGTTNTTVRDSFGTDLAGMDTQYLRTENRTSHIEERSFGGGTYSQSWSTTTAIDSRSGYTNLYETREYTHLPPSMANWDDSLQSTWGQPQGPSAMPLPSDWADTFGGGTYQLAGRQTSLSLGNWAGVTYGDGWVDGRFVPETRSLNFGGSLDVPLPHGFGVGANLSRGYSDRWNGSSYEPFQRTTDMGLRGWFGLTDDLSVNAGIGRTYTDRWNGSRYSPYSRGTDVNLAAFRLGYQDTWDGSRYAPDNRSVGVGPVTWQDDWGGQRYDPAGRTVNFGIVKYGDSWDGTSYSPQNRSVGFGGPGFGVRWDDGASGDGYAPKTRTFELGPFRLSQSFQNGRYASVPFSEPFGTSFHTGFGLRPGGIMLDKAAEYLGDLKEIEGAYYDPDRGALVVVGRTDLPLPPMAPADVAVAVRAVYDYGEDPGVSIDPIPGRDDISKVVYFGHTENTRFGQVLFEADRILKIMAAGKDNITGDPVHFDVEGYTSHLQRQQEIAEAVVLVDTGSPDDTMIRFWFHPGRVLIGRSQDGRSMVFMEDSVKLSWESMTGPLPPDLRAATRARVDHMNANFDAYETAIPVFAELRQLMRIASVVKWLSETGVAFDRAAVSPELIEYVPTPEVTPMIHTEYVLQGRLGLQVCRLSGGVDLDVDNEYAPDPEAERLAEEARAAGDDGEVTWDFDSDGETYRAVALPAGHV